MKFLPIGVRAIKKRRARRKPRFVNKNNLPLEIKITETQFLNDNFCDNLKNQGYYFCGFDKENFGVYRLKL